MYDCLSDDICLEVLRTQVQLIAKHSLQFIYIVITSQPEQNIFHTFANIKQTLIEDYYAVF